MLGIPRNGNAPVEAGSADRQIAQAAAHERMQEMEEKYQTQTAAEAGKSAMPIHDVPTTKVAETESTATPPPPAPAVSLASSLPPSEAKQPDAAPITGTGPAPVAGEAAKIGIEDFAKVELRVAIIRVAERVPKADRLLRLEVDLGYEQRQIVAGIAEAYAPESLIGRKVVIVANLAPRKLRGLESNGMIVAASVGEKGTPVLAGFLEDVEIGARLK